jgi:hypothetical protein
MAKQRDAKREGFWRSVFDKHRRSGLSVRAFCRQEKISEPSFYAWRRTLQRRRRDPQEQKKRKQRGQEDKPGRVSAVTRQTGPGIHARPAFLPVVVRDAQPDGGASVTGDACVIVEVRGGRALRLPASISGNRLTELVRAVESVPVPAEDSV